MLDVGLRNGGFRKVLTALTFAWCWAVVWAELDRPPTIHEYYEWWGQSRATAYREQQCWQTCFPHEDVDEFIQRVGLVERARPAMQAIKDLKGGSTPRTRESRMQSVVMDIGSMAAYAP
jgi:hypothetical protein